MLSNILLSSLSSSHWLQYLHWLQQQCHHSGSATEEMAHQDKLKETERKRENYKIDKTDKITLITVQLLYSCNDVMIKIPNSATGSILSYKI